jgi:hypothetical protein
MYGTSGRENREIPRSPIRLITGRAAQGTHGGTPGMHERGKSDRLVVPANPPNKAAEAAAEVGEERRRAKGNTVSKTRPGRSAGVDASGALGRVREVARRDRNARLTALLHHVSLGRLGAAYWAIRRQAAPGVDGVTWAEYGQDLEANLQDLHGRVQSGRYRANQVGGRRYQRRTGGCGRWVSPRWRTRSFSGRSSRYSTPSTRWISGASRTGSGRGGVRMMRWTRSRQGSTRRR